jgi:hypothetical protein
MHHEKTHCVNFCIVIDDADDMGLQANAFVDQKKGQAKARP